MTSPKRACIAQGFYAAASAKAPDRVVCFACENALTNWDPTDDPWQEHQTWYPQVRRAASLERRGAAAVAGRSSRGPGAGAQADGALVLAVPARARAGDRQRH